ncbi:hypothetical protein [uncultured Bacteroides sp.]|uniref:hypothetical protein n=1 Tax=uncultured Bacteroides sp. TaxID=162156 RepID=UPI002AAA6C2A|nr:hypothetical protein [uncultured Bacteroides sp.]
MENILNKFIGDRSGSILDHINRYCLSENKSKLDVVRVVFNFLEGIKTTLDDKFVEVCLYHITKEKDDLTKLAYRNCTASVMRITLNDPEIGEDYLNRLIQIEGNRGSISKLIKFCLNEDLTDWEKVWALEKMEQEADNILYYMFLGSLFYSNKSGIEIKYKNKVDEIIIHEYNRLEYAMDFDLVNAEYNSLIKRQGSKGNPTEEKRAFKKLSDDEIDLLFSGLKGCFEPYNKEHFIFAFSGGTRPIDYNGLKWNKKDTQFCYLIAGLFMNGATVDWSVAYQFGIKNPDQKKNNYQLNKDEKPKGCDYIDKMLSRIK